MPNISGLGGPKKKFREKEYEKQQRNEKAQKAEAEKAKTSSNQRKKQAARALKSCVNAILKVIIAPIKLASVLFDGVDLDGNPASVFRSQEQTVADPQKNPNSTSSSPSTSRSGSGSTSRSTSTKFGSFAPPSTSPSTSRSGSGSTSRSTSDLTSPSTSRSGSGSTSRSTSDLTSRSSSISSSHRSIYSGRTADKIIEASQNARSRKKVDTLYQLTKQVENMVTQAQSGQTKNLAEVWNELHSENPVDLNPPKTSRKSSLRKSPPPSGPKNPSPPGILKKDPQDSSQSGSSSPKSGVKFAKNQETVIETQKSDLPTHKKRKNPN